MAKPGSNAARRLSAQAHDLSAASMTDQEAWATHELVELKLGMRCHGCRRRIAMGLKFTSIDVKDGQAPVATRCACNREDCDFAERCRSGATVVEMVEFAWLDEAGVDAPPVGLKPDESPPAST